MIEVYIPNCCEPEVRYTFHCLLHVFLGLEYTINTTDKCKDFVLVGPKGKVVIKNSFFTDDNLNHLYAVNNIPSITSTSQIEIGAVLYKYECMFGEAKWTRTVENLYFSSDIISATYFMLTRWEEYVSKDRDDHNRFPGQSSVAYRNDFLGRAIVNEYVELIYALLLDIGITSKRIKRDYKVVPTHDVDHPYMWMTSKSIFRSLGHSLIVNPRYEDLKLKVIACIKGNDLFDTYDELMNRAEEIDVRAEFYFMAGGISKYDSGYNIFEERLVSLIKKIEYRGHVVGLHPSYSSYKDEQILIKEKSVLESVSRGPVRYGRQHFLNFMLPDTWSILNKCGMEADSTLGYAEASGFRCGVCYPYPVFDIKKREMLSLVERPLIVMDVTLLQYESRSEEEAISKVKELQSEVKKFNGEFVFLWHNSSFNTAQWNSYERVFDQMYSSLVA